jgi:GcrA cell cycle regulator
MSWCGPNPWTPDDDAKLADMWNAGYAAAVISDALGRTRNSVIGRAHRRGLDGRPSPIKAKPGTEPAPPKRTPTPGLPKRGPGALPSGSCLSPMQSDTAAAAPPIAKLEIVETEVVTVFRPRAARPCCWVDGQRGSYRYCDEPAPAGRSYCDAHHRRAHAAPPAGPSQIAAGMGWGATGKP